MRTSLASSSSTRSRRPPPSAGRAENSLTTATAATCCSPGCPPPAAAKRTAGSRLLRATRLGSRWCGTITTILRESTWTSSFSPCRARTPTARRTPRMTPRAPSRSSEHRSAPARHCLDTGRSTCESPLGRWCCSARSTPRATTWRPPSRRTSFAQGTASSPSASTTTRPWPCLCFARSGVMRQSHRAFRTGASPERQPMPLRRPLRRLRRQHQLRRRPRREPPRDSSANGDVACSLDGPRAHVRL
mmetsp:Transcript_54590/g.168091  ORF Transcript_54590/g.168091 Transcript_54590/m.168091 type:complete len:246 (+) Transcript_54590:1848-2585(+)